MILEPFFRVFCIFLKTALQVIRGGNINFYAIHGLQVITIIPARQGVLREYVERIGIRLRFAESRGQSPARVGAAKINAAGRYRTDDVINRDLGVFRIARLKVVGQTDFQDGLPVAGVEIGVHWNAGPALILRVPFQKTLKHVGHGLPIAVGGRIKEALKLRRNCFSRRRRQCLRLFELGR